MAGEANLIEANSIPTRNEHPSMRCAGTSTWWLPLSHCKNRIERCGHQGFSEFSLHCPNHAHGQKFDPDSQNCQNTFCRDRMARDCTIRHPVRPIVALQRRLRFSARLAWVFKIRCHQRRAIRAEQASFSVLVSNLDFRVPRLRQIGERALTGPCGWREKRPPERLRIEAGATAA